MNWILKYIFFATLIICMINSCKSKIEVIEPPTELEIKVLKKAKDNSFVDANGAILAVFDDSAKYAKASETFTVTGAVAVDTSQKGTCNFTLKPSQKYYIAAYYVDSVWYTKPYIYQDNALLGAELLRPLNKSAKTFATITMDPAQALVTLYAGGTTASNIKLPIKLRIDNQQLQDLTRTFTTPPAPYDSGTTTLLIRRGRRPINFSDRFGCSSLRDTLIEGGKNYIIDANTCNAGRVAFWTVNENTSILPINVVIGINNTIGGISRTLVANHANPCQTNAILVYLLEPGEYTYTATNAKASSTGGKCLWTGKFTVVANQCAAIKLDQCF
ncbi:MAG: hypothetical protein NW207_12785 [Cytophagales bacterium]|nr:hypothetical protein [Cytophagales bacterium]